MIFDDTFSVWLTGTEQVLVKQLNQGEVPFLGGYLDFLDEKSRKYFKNKLINTRDPIQAIIIGLNKWPAIFSTYLTVFVVEGYGKDKHAAVWPYLDEALGNRDYHREKLWSVYRAACIKAGLPVLSRKSGNLYMVNEFLHQAGVPLGSIPKLAKRMYKYAKSNGMPEEDDAQSIKQWRKGLLDNIGIIHKPVLRALESDDSDYFPRLFLQFHKQNIHDSNNRLEKAFLDQLSKIQQGKDVSSIKEFKVPIVVWRDGHICVELPASEDDTWVILSNGGKFQCAGLSDNQIVPLTAELPYTVEVSNSSDKQQRKLDLWKDDANNRFLLFDVQGIFVRSCSLSESVIFLEPGKYTVVSRFIPNGYDGVSAEEVSSYPEVHNFSIELLPGEKEELGRGPVTITLQADSKPIFTWIGSHLQGVRGKELFASEDLSIQLQIPGELHVDGEDLFIRLSSGGASGISVDIPANFDDKNVICFLLTPICNQWKTGLIRLSATLFRKGGKRALTRSSIYLWNGLKEITHHHCFEYIKKPQNINEIDSDNVKIDDKFLTYKDDSNRFFRTVFDFDNKRQVSFTWAVPGTFMRLEQYSEGSLVEKPLSKGTLLPVSDGSRDALKFFSDKSGIIRFGNFQSVFDASRSRYKRIPLLSLVDYITPDESTLYFQSGSHNEVETLLHLTAPEIVLQFDSIRLHDNYQVIFLLSTFSDEIEVSALNLINGRKQHEKLIANDPSNLLSSRDRLWFSNEQSLPEVVKHTVSIPISKLGSGAWILNFKIKVGKNWRSLSNYEQETYSAGFVSTGWSMISIDAFLPDLDGYKETMLLKSFKNVHTSLLKNYSKESWKEIQWVKELWFELSKRLSVDNKQTLIELVRLSVKRPNESTSSTLVPICSINASFLEMFSLPAKRYRHLNNKTHLSFQILNLMSTFSTNLTELFNSKIINPTAAIGFSNVMNMMAGEEPIGFSLKRYKDALVSQNLSDRIRLLSQEDWHPGEGYYLGALHYHYATEKMRESYRMTSEYSHGFQIYSFLLEFDNFRLNDFVGGAPDIWAVDNIKNYLGLLNIDPDIITYDQRFLLSMVRFLSIFALMCRWEARNADAFNGLKNKLEYILDINSKQIEFSMAYILFVGEDIFYYYLLLWEFVIVAYEHQPSIIE